jgi:hypothetical protein
VATSAFRSCDFFGACIDPEIQCNGATQRIGQDGLFCCNLPFAGTHVEVVFTTADCLASVGAPMFCDTDDDCRDGGVCARNDQGGTACAAAGTTEGLICGNSRFGFEFRACPAPLRCDITPATASESTFFPLPLDWGSCFP